MSLLCELQELIEKQANIIVILLEELRQYREITEEEKKYLD